MPGILKPGHNANSSRQCRRHNGPDAGSEPTRIYRQDAYQTPPQGALFLKQLASLRCMLRAVGIGRLLFPVGSLGQGGKGRKHFPAGVQLAHLVCAVGSRAALDGRSSAEITALFRSHNGIPATIVPTLRIWKAFTMSPMPCMRSQIPANTSSTYALV